MSVTSGFPTLGRFEGPALPVQPILHGNSWANNQVNLGYTPMGLVGGHVHPQLPGPGGELGARSFTSPLRGLFNEGMTSAPFGFTAQENIGPMVIDEHHVGKVNPQITALATFLSVILAGSWLTRISTFNITNKQTKWRRYDITRVLTAVRVGHTDIPKTTTNRSISWMTSGDRYGTAADARLQELQDPEIGPAVAQRMINQIVAGMVHRLQLSIMEQAYNEGCMRPWFESAGKFNTAEAFMDDGMFNRRRFFGMLNYTPDVMATKFNKFVETTMGAIRNRIVGVLPFAARHRYIQANEMSSTAYARMTGNVSVDPFTARTLVGFNNIDRASIFPTDVTLLGDSVGRQFSQIGDVPFYLEPAPSLNLGEQDSGLSVLQGDAIFSTYHCNPAFNNAGVLAAQPNSFQIYSQGLDNYAHIRPAELLRGIGAWDVDNSESFMPGHFPSAAQIKEGFGPGLEKLREHLDTKKSMVHHYWQNRQQDILKNPRTAATRVSMRSVLEGNMTQMRHVAMSPFCSNWNDKVEIPTVIGHMHPDLFLHAHAVEYARATVEKMESTAQFGKMTPDAILTEMNDIINTIRAIEPKTDYLNRLFEGSTPVKSPIDSEAEYPTTSNGGVPLRGAITALDQIAGYTTYGTLEMLANLSDGLAGPATPIVNKLRNVWPHFKQLMNKLFKQFPYSFLFAKNVLPAGLQPQRGGNHLTAAVWNLWPGQFIAKTGGVASDAARPSGDLVEDYVNRFVVRNGVLLFDVDDIQNSGLSLQEFVDDSDGPFFEDIKQEGLPKKILEFYPDESVALAVNRLYTTSDNFVAPVIRSIIEESHKAYLKGARTVKDFVAAASAVAAATRPFYSNSTRVRLPLVFGNIKIPGGYQRVQIKNNTDYTSEQAQENRAALIRQQKELASRIRGDVVEDDAMEVDKEESLARTFTKAYRGERIDHEEDATERALRGITTDEITSDLFQYQMGSENQREILVNRLRFLELYPQSLSVNFITKLLYTTPNIYDAFVKLADAELPALPFNTVALRLHQRFDTYALMLIEIGGPVVDTTPMYIVFLADQARDYVVVTSRCMQNISLRNFNSVAIADNAYIREQKSGRDVGIITPWVAEEWSEDDFYTRQQTASIVVLAEPIWNDLGDIFSLNNIASDYARRTLREKGIPSIGISYGIDLAKFCLGQYFGFHTRKVAERKLSMPGSYQSYASQLENVAGMVQGYKTDVFFNEYIYRGYTVIRDHGDELKHLRGCAFCEVNDECLNRPGTNVRIANQQAIDASTPLRIQSVM